MTTKLNLNTDALSEEIEKIKAKKDRLAEIYEALRKSNNELKNNWNSKTSDIVFNNFEDFYNGFQQQIDNFQNDIDFLNAVIAKYKEFEDVNIKTIDEKIAI